MPSTIKIKFNIKKDSEGRGAIGAKEYPDIFSKIKKFMKYKIETILSSFKNFENFNFIEYSLVIRFIEKQKKIF